MTPHMDNYDLTRDQLDWLSPDCVRDDWVAIGQAIHSEWPDDRGLALFDEWSRRAPGRYNEAALLSTWKSFRPGGGRTIGNTIESAAIKAGWTHPEKTGRKLPPRPAPKTPQAGAGATFEVSRRVYPPTELIDALWRISGHPQDDKSALRWLHLRKLDDLSGDLARVTPTRIDDADLRRVRPLIPVARGRRIPGRLIVPLYNARGVMQSFTGRAIDGATLKVKAARPTGFKAAGLVMCNAQALTMLAKPDKFDAPALVIVEGEPDFLTRCLTNPELAVIGIYTGGWKQAHADAVPDGLPVFIETDRDLQGEKYAQVIVKTIARRAPCLRLSDAPAGDINDLHVAGTLRAPDLQCTLKMLPDADKSVAVRPACEAPHPADAAEPAPSGPRPAVQINYDQLDSIIAQTRDVLVANNKQGKNPRVFRRGKELVQVYQTDLPGIGLQLITMQPVDVLHHLVHIANWVKETKESIVDAKPDRDLVSIITAIPDRRLPILELVTRSPLVAADGTICEREGYNPAAMCWYDRKPGFKLPPIPKAPSAAQLKAARELLLDEMLHDFPFIGAADRANAIAYMLCIVARRMISGPAPLHLFAASSPGSGKSLLVAALTLVATGAMAAAQAMPTTSDEMGKTLTALLMEGASVILWDNASEKKTIDDPVLAAVLTTEMWQGRILGKSEIVMVPNRAVQTITANNPQLNRDIARRTVKIGIDPEMERPWDRADFLHKNLIFWVENNRAQLVAALLTIVQAWIAAGKPEFSGTLLGSFESYSATVGGMLDVAGIDGFLRNNLDLYSEADAESADWRDALEFWHEQHGTQPVRPANLALEFTEAELLPQVLSSPTERGRSSAFGRKIKEMIKRPFDGRRIVHARLNGRLAYALEIIAESETKPDEMEDIF